MCDALVAIDAGPLARHKKLGMDRRCARRLLGKVHRDRRVAVATLQRVIRLQPRPFVLGQLQPLLLKFFARINRAKDLAPDFLRGLHLAGDLVGPVMRHVAVRAGGAYARTVGVMRRPLQLLIHIVMHLVAAGAELLGIGHFQRSVETTPEDHAAEKAAERQHAEADMRGRPAGDPPEPEQFRQPPFHEPHLPSSFMSVKVFGTSGRASVWVTWQAVQK